MKLMFIILFIFVFGIPLLKEEVFTRPVPPNTDYRQAVIDSYKYNLSGKELDRRLTNGYYVKKDK